MIAVIDYNVGNVKSVCNAFRHIGCTVELSCEPDAIEDAARMDWQAIIVRPNKRIKSDGESIGRQGGENLMFWDGGREAGIRA